MGNWDRNNDMDSIIAQWKPDSIPLILKLINVFITLKAKGFMQQTKHEWSYFVSQ